MAAVASVFGFTEQVVSILGVVLDPVIGVAPVLLILAIVVPGFLAIAARPQYGILAMAAFVPYRGLLAIVPSAPAFAEGFKEFLVLYTVLWAIFNAVGKERPPSAVPIFVAPLVLSFVVALISALKVGGLQGLVGLKLGFFYTLVLLAMWLCPLNRGQRNALVTILIVNGLVTALVGLWQQLVGEDRLVGLGYEYGVHVRTTQQYLRSFSTFNQPFPFAFFLAMVILLGIAVALADLGSLRSKIFLVTVPVLSTALVFTFVRGAWLILGLGFAYLAFHRYRWLLLLAPLALLSLLVLPGQFGAAAFASGSFNERQVGWTENLGKVTSQPIGNGIGTTGASAEKTIDVKDSFAAFYQPDNQYFKVLYELGVIGLWLFVLVLVFSFAYTRQVERKLTGFDRALVIGVSAHILGIAAACFVATYFEVFPLELYFWLLLGVVENCSRESS